jgi:hypothetical protein
MLEGASKNYNFCVSLGTSDDSPAVITAGAVLAKLTGGVYFDVDEPLDTEHALKLAHEQAARYQG